VEGSQVAIWVLQPLVPSLLEVRPMPVGVVRVERVQRHFPGSKPAVAVVAVGNYWATRVGGSANAWAAVSTR
jgi:hypothetical protein